MKTTRLLFVFLLGSTGFGAAEANREAEARRLTADAFALLSKNLAEAIARDGVPGAIGFCAEQALPLTDSVGANAGATVRRVSHRARNPKNRADAAERELIAGFAATLKTGGTPQPHLRRNADGSDTFFAPIVLANPLCLKCHGLPGQDMDADTLSALGRLYPQDEATGFRMGEVRGLWRVDFLSASAAKPAQP